MTTSEKLATRITQNILRGEIDPSKVNGIEKKVGIKLYLTEEQLEWAMLAYQNRQEFANNK